MATTITIPDTTITANSTEPFIGFYLENIVKVRHKGQLHQIKMETEFHTRSGDYIRTEYREIEELIEQLQAIIE